MYTASYPANKPYPTYFIPYHPNIGIEVKNKTKLRNT